MFGGNNVGSIEYDARINTSRLRGDAAETDAIVKNTGDNVSTTGEKSFSDFGRFAKVGLAAAATAVAAVGAVIAVNIGDAVRRVDTLNAFPRVLQAMGTSAGDAKSATDKLSKSLEGLPTSLDQGAQGVQQFVAAGLKANKATDAYLAMNDALLASGGNAQDTQIVMESLTRALSGGTTEATTIQAALSRMPTALQGLQKETGKSAGELYKLYAADPQRLTDDLIKLDKQGGGGLSSLSEQAKEATKGIGTGWQNMNTAIQRGIASVISYIGSENIANFLTSVGKAFEDIAKAIPPAIEMVKGFLTDIMTYMKPVTDFIANNKQAWDVLKMALLAIAITIGLVIVAVGIGLVGAFAIIMAVINAAIWVVTGIINAIVWLGNVIADVIYAYMQFSGAVVSAIGTAGNAMGQFVSSVGKGIGDAINWFISLPGKILNALSGAGNWLYNIGKDMIQGLINGIQDMVKNVQKVAGDIGKSVQDKFKSVMGIHSPSTVFAMYGKNIAQGLSIGINNNAGLANNSISSMIGGISTPGLSSPLSIDSLDTSQSSAVGSNVTINLSGIMTRSKSDERDIAKSLVKRLNEELSAKGSDLIGGGAI